MFKPCYMNFASSANLDLNHAYDILVAAVNEVGLSDYASTFLPAGKTISVYHFFSSINLVHLWSEFQKEIVISKNTTKAWK